MGLARFLADVYAPQANPYDVRGSFFGTFGRDPGWWLTLLLVLFVLFVLDVGFKIAKRTLRTFGLWQRSRGCLRQVKRWENARRENWRDENIEEWGLRLWQELEKDRKVREQLTSMLEEEENRTRGVVFEKDA